MNNQNEPNSSTPPQASAKLERCDNITREAKFPLGRIVVTTHATEEISPIDIITGLARHESGDWGEIDEEDRKENEFSLAEGFRLMSVYTAANGTKFWIITEWDRSITTVLLPDDY